MSNANINISHPVFSIFIYFHIFRVQLSTSDRSTCLFVFLSSDIERATSAEADDFMGSPTQVVTDTYLCCKDNPLPRGGSCDESKCLVACNRDCGNGKGAMCKQNKCHCKC